MLRIQKEKNTVERGVIKGCELHVEVISSQAWLHHEMPRHPRAARRARLVAVGPSGDPEQGAGSSTCSRKEPGKAFTQLSPDPSSCGICSFQCYAVAL